VTEGAAAAPARSRILVRVVETMQVVTAVCALLAGAGAVALLIARLLASRAPAVAALGRAVTHRRSELTLVVASASMVGSLYFSESADFAPCTYCWYQRIAMYPLVLVAAVGLWRRDAAARWYSVTIAAVGLCLSVYHYLLEWNPDWESGSCALFGPVCAVPWFRTFGFVSLAFMALSAFTAIIVVNLVSFDPRAEPLLGEEPS
jgi:disulfide bond formation protein DsbB